MASTHPKKFSRKIYRAKWVYSIPASTHLLRLLLEYWRIADTTDTMGTDRFFANTVAPMMVCYIQLDISYTMHKSMIALNFLSVAVVALNAG